MHFDKNHLKSHLLCPINIFILLPIFFLFSRDIYLVKTYLVPFKIFSLVVIINSGKLPDTSV